MLFAGDQGPKLVIAAVCMLQPHRPDGGCSCFVAIGTIDMIFFPQLGWVLLLITCVGGMVLLIPSLLFTSVMASTRGRRGLAMPPLHQVQGICQCPGTPLDSVNT